MKNIGAVNFFNVLPLVYGFEKGMLQDKMTLEFDYPSILGKKFFHGIYDIALISISNLIKAPKQPFIQDIGIASNDRVASVGIFSQVPIQEIRSIYLDNRSETSNLLVKILIKEYWKLNVQFLNSSDSEFKPTEPTTAILMIGDRALKAYQEYFYRYDLAYYWKMLTGLPFVFAAWFYQTNVEQDFLTEFTNASKYGLNYFEEIVAKTNCSYYNLMTYFESNLVFNLTDNHLSAIELFIEKGKKYL